MQRWSGSATLVIDAVPGSARGYVGLQVDTDSTDQGTSPAEAAQAAADSPADGAEGQQPLPSISDDSEDIDLDSIIAGSPQDESTATQGS